MERIAEWRECSAVETEREERIKQRIFEKVARRMDQLRNDGPICAELNPDIIVVTTEQGFLFEPQNLQVVEWLHRHFGAENLRVRERVRIQPALCQMMTSELKAAGFEVAF